MGREMNKETKVGVFNTVGDLIDYLEKLGRDRTLIYVFGGNIFPIDSNDICLWDEEQLDSPVALFVNPARS